MKSNLKRNENFDITRSLMIRSTWRGILPNMETWLNMKKEWIRTILWLLRTRRLFLTILCLVSCQKLSFLLTQSLIRKQNEWWINQLIEIKEQSRSLEIHILESQTLELKTLDSQPQLFNIQSHRSSTKQNTTLIKSILCTKPQTLHSKTQKCSAFINLKMNLSK